MVDYNHLSHIRQRLDDSVSQADAEAGTSEAVQQWSPMRVKQAIQALAPGGGGGNPNWGDVGGTLSNQTDLQSALNAKAATSHNHDSTYLTAITKVMVEAVLTGEISSHSHAGGGAVTPTHTLVFEGTLSSASQNTNAATNFTWNDSVEHSDVTHTDGESAVGLAAGEYDIFYNIEVTDGAGNNRQTWALDLMHRDSGDVEQFTYGLGAGSYIRDDASTYDSGRIAGHFNLVVAAGDDITLQSRVLDAQTGAGVNNANQTVSYLRIMKKTYG